MVHTVRLGLWWALLIACLCCWTDQKSFAQNVQQLQPSRFVHHSKTADTVIVFIHGISGDSRTTWTSDNGTYWPELLTQDKTFDGVNIYVYQYQTSILTDDVSLLQTMNMNRALQTSSTHF